MHYNIDYTKEYPNEAQRKAAAMNDIKDYLGVTRYKKIVKAVVADQKITRKSFIFQLSMFVGIEGYPAEVFADELGLTD